MYNIPVDRLVFPHPGLADSDGLLAVGGDLSPQRLLLAYTYGIFPWFSEGDPILWWSPDPRFVLFPQKVKISKSMRGVLKKGIFRFTKNQAFEQVIRGCAENGIGTPWLLPEMQEAYIELHRMGYAQSFETWAGDELVGGFYGVKVGSNFFGESMFSRQSNASKAAFILACRQWQAEGVQLIDCQVYTEHLESLGAEMISRESFLQFLGV
jgi:leucyl/phenylalanyl-tRNA---protein transferase